MTRFFLLILTIFCAACLSNTRNLQWEFTDTVEAGHKPKVGEDIDINGNDRYGRNLLRVAVAMDDIERVKYLLSNGADPFVSDSSGLSAYEYAARNRKWKSLELFVPLVRGFKEENSNLFYLQNDSVPAKKAIPATQNLVPAKTIVLANIPEVPGMVKIPGQNYYIKKYEVTQSEYKKVMGTNPSKFKGDDLPVENVSWNDAMAFCNKLTTIERNAGRLPSGYKYTLPTSEQWEIACRAGTKTKFCSGDYERDLARVAWYSENSGNKTHPVGQKEPNAWGIYDMHGNVWEWCLDERYNGFKRVNRGGSWHSDASFCGSSGVYGDVPSSRDDNLGFRIALVPAR